MVQSYSIISGLFECHWREEAVKDNRTSWWDKVWSVLLILAFFFCLTWMISWAAASNSKDYLQEFLFPHFGYFSWRLLLLILSVICTFYLAVLIVLFFLHVYLGKQIYISWLHKVVILFIIIGCLFATIALLVYMPNAWMLTYLFLNHHWVIIHPIITTLLVPVAYANAKAFFRSEKRGFVTFGMTAYIIVVIGTYVSPVYLKSPCIINAKELPPKPRMIAHRGGSGLGPENTKFAFEESLKYDVFGFEADVTISFDGVPFLSHDNNLRRVTNVDDVFPERNKLVPSDFNMTDLLELNFGSWYIESDLFGTVAGLSQEDKRQISHQRVATFEEVLHIVKESNTSFVFDRTFKGEQIHPYAEKANQIFIDLIEEVGLNPRKVIWVHYTTMIKNSEKFVGGSEELLPVEKMKEGNIELLNVAFMETDFKHFKEYQENNISIIVYTVNDPWLFSMYWCAGINMTTTSDIEAIYKLEFPSLIVSPILHLALWILFDAGTAIAIIFITIYVRYDEYRSQADLPAGLGMKGLFGQ